MWEYIVTSAELWEPTDSGRGRWARHPTVVEPYDGDGWELCGSAANEINIFWTWRRPKR